MKRCKCIGMLSGGKWERNIDPSRRVYDTDGLSPTINTAGGGNHVPKIQEQTDGEVYVRIRKLTPRECWRLMDFTDEDFDKCRPIQSDAQLYKQAGNSIVVSCLEQILHNLLVNPGGDVQIKFDI